MTEPLYSDAHPEYTVDDSADPAKDKSELETPAKEVPAAADSTSAAEAILTQSYVQKAVAFLVILTIIFLVVRRRRSTYTKLDEKSMA